MLGNIRYDLYDIIYDPCVTTKKFHPGLSHFVKKIAMLNQLERKVPQVFTTPMLLALFQFSVVRSI